MGETSLPVLMKEIGEALKLDNDGNDKVCIVAEMDFIEVVLFYSFSFLTFWEGDWAIHISQK